MDITLNTSAKWKKIFCLVMLFFYCSNISIPLGIPALDSVRDIGNIILVIVMLPDIAGKAKKFGSNGFLRGRLSTDRADLRGSYTKHNDFTILIYAKIREIRGDIFISADLRVPVNADRTPTRTAPYKLVA